MARARDWARASAVPGRVTRHRAHRRGARPVLGVRTRVTGLVAGVAATSSWRRMRSATSITCTCSTSARSCSRSSTQTPRLRSASSPARSARSSLALMRAFVASIYLWAVVGKLASEWGTGAALAMFRESGVARPISWLLTAERYAAIEVCVIAIELAIGAGLLWPRTRAGRADRCLRASRDVRDRRARGHDRLADVRAPARVHSQCASSTGHAMSDCTHISSWIVGPGRSSGRCRSASRSGSRCS